MATHREYTVGLVCALELELIAVAAMLDERYKDLSKPSDNNSYILGRVGVYNVVVACPKYGFDINKVAGRMISTFPSIKIGLTVGIGSGVPESVRLGDVVVSEPTNELSGMVQLDFEEVTLRGNIRFTESLNCPPIELLTALKALKREHAICGSKNPEYLKYLEFLRPNFVPKHARLECLRDRLFKADCQHICNPPFDDANAGAQDKGNIETEEEEDHCIHCDQTKIIHREPRGMRVHHGLIVSSNPVIKDALTRDNINTRFGGNVLCFEMGAAGLMDDFPCLVIRGICDYADSHKNRGWRDRAALVAATFSRELILLLPAQEVEQMPTIQERGGSLLRDEICSHQQNQEYQTKDTFEWLLNSSEFQHNAKDQILWLQGTPGAGKMIISYELAMQQVQEQVYEHQKLANQVLSFISSANRPLTPAELQHAISIEENSDELGKNNVADIELILSVCGGLVTVDNERNTIDLVHSSAQEYLELNRERWFPNFHTDIANSKDGVSEISAEVSLWSAFETDDSESSFGGLHVSREACEKLAEVLCKDIDLRTLYLEALTLLGKGRFSKNHDQILKRFFKSLRSEVDDTLHLQTIRLLRYASSREQITEWILRLCVPSPDLETLRSRQKFLDQKEFRDEILNRFLEDQAVGLHDKGDRKNQLDHEISSENSEDDDEASSEDAEDGNGPIRFEQLQAIISFLTRGPSYEDLKSDLYLLVHPPTGIPEAIQLGGVRSLRKLLEKRFSEIVTGEYAWIKELSEAGYSYYEISELLYQDETDTPWIYFELEAPSPLEMSFKRSLSVSKDQQGPKNFKSCAVWGVIPASRDPSKWNGAVTFKEKNTVAVVSITTALDWSCAAAGTMQTSGLCCDCFTVIVHRTHEPEFDEELTPVSLYRINFDSVLEVLAELKGISSSDHIAQSKLTNILRLLHDILDPIFQDFQGTFQSNDLEASLHSLSLAVQFISLGLLSYNQGHVGPIQPFFLDTPQRKILLAGSKLCEHHSDGIIAELMNLTCIGDMVGGPVLSFKIAQLSMDGPYLQEERKFDLMATAEDLLDTWGPGGFIVHRDTGASPCAIKLCGGIIYATRENTPKYHWSPSTQVGQFYPVHMNPQSKICIGSLVTINSYCNINERECWERSSCAFENLDVHDDFWTYDENQTGFQAGNYVLLQANITRHRLSGKTLKKVILEWETEMLIPALNCLWGLQVSFCTGVTKRVPLRELIADVLPTFTNTFIRERARWVELEEQYHILDAFRKDDFQGWLANLPPKLYSYVIRVVRRIIRTLQSTGIDPEGRYLSVAWPYDSPPFRCFRISCHDRENSWARVLADSEDCATFAYISTKCLVTNRVQCQGPSPLWRSTTPLLQTAIIRHNGNYPGSLESKRTHFFKKPDSLLKVMVERQGDSGAITLLVAPSTVPARVQQRLYRLDMMRSQ
ncbi:uncharacterized protein TRUGW13939_00445 [Talaromyces rugulosus]|uniref:Nucleoside phosphorylase domain-containing protein n=1 Tax=Talaromyces rugulosus TaxID=121627 RepID=A0A7H8QHB8_TALRU|nr:uncharacterized protein TRUGW13939_00445 [Talaromyces rugulosus]QKX53367.1 hypothetical protein TRUGW13939_00445 [Talaromyces rugulosus]